MTEKLLIAPPKLKFWLTTSTNGPIGGRPPTGPLPIVIGTGLLKRVVKGRGKRPSR